LITRIEELVEEIVEFRGIEIPIKTHSKEFYQRRCISELTLEIAKYFYALYGDSNNTTKQNNKRRKKSKDISRSRSKSSISHVDFGFVTR